MPEKTDKELGKHLAQLRKERGYTQKELAEKMAIPWPLISDYERGKLRLHDKIIVKFTKALEVNSDEILGISSSEKKLKYKPSLKIIRRMQRIEALPESQQKFILKAIDSLIAQEELKQKKKD